MADVQVSVLSREYVRFPVSAREAGAVVNPTSLPVAVAVVASGDPAPADLKTAAWETDGTAYFARILVGGTGTGATIELAKGRYQAWVKVTDNPEVPVKRAGILEVF